MRFYTRPRRNPVVNIVSLIDILCIVLIFFVVTTTFRRDEPQIQLQLPASHNAKPSQNSLPSIISVTKNGDIYLESTRVSIESLAATLKEKVAATPTAKFALKSSKQAPFGVIVKVMDAVRDSGLETLPTFTDPETPSTP